MEAEAAAAAEAVDAAGAAAAEAAEAAVAGAEKKGVENRIKSTQTCKFHLFNS